MKLIHSTLLLILLPHVIFTEKAKCPLLRATAASETDKTGCFIVVLNKATTADKFQEILAKVVNMSEDAKVYGSVQRVAKAFTVKLSEVALEVARSIPEIDFIEEETMAHGDQVEWHLDRIDQLTCSFDGFYQPIGTGEGVDIYILDTGINYDHQEFEGRAKYSGYDPTDIAESANQRGVDCHGHGTHVASLAGGKTYGSAKNVRIYSIRVLNCNNFGAWSTILNGIDHASQVIADRGRPAIVSMSLVGSYTRSVQDAVQTLHSEGIVVVVAAGNGFRDACTRTPASSSYVITVGGSSNCDGIYYYTNYGSCVDIFAPGSNIRGADHTCVSCSKVISGTSMSTPLVSGVAAILLGREPRLSPTAMKNQLTASAVPNVLNFSRFPNTHRSTTPNRHLYIPGNCGGLLSGSSGTLKTPNNPSNYSANLYCKWTITATPGNMVQLTFTTFNTEEDYDIVSVCEGLICSPESRWVQLSGTSSQSNVRYKSARNVLTVELVSDAIVESGGFSATYSTTDTSPTTQPPTTQPPTTQPPTTQPPTTQPRTTQPRTTQPPTTQSPTTQPPTTQPPMTQPPMTQPPATQPPTTQPPTTKPPTTQPPTTQPPTTQPPTTQPPTTQPPTTQPPTTQPPATQPPTTQPPTTQPPTTQPPTTQPPTTQPPTTQPPATQPMTQPQHPDGVITTTQAPTAVTSPHFKNCDVDNEVASRVPILVSEIIQEASITLHTLISDSLESLLITRILGQVSSYPANSCKQIADTRSSDNLNSGLYWVKSGNGSAIRVFCDLKNSFTTSDLGWMRAGLLNMTESASECPDSLRLIETPKRSCGRGQSDPGCSSVFYPTYGVNYQQVCGKVTGYQLGSTNAFFAYGYDSSLTLDNYYIDGVSITRGSSPRQHIWTFAAARDEVSADSHICPCTNSEGTLSTSPIPPYVGQNYFCETGTATSAVNGVFYADDPLWDGFGCGSGSSCCSKTNPPYFCIDIGVEVNDDIELRVCGNENRASEDTPLELVELYIR